MASFIAEQQAAGEQGDISRAVGELAQAWGKEAAKPGKDFGALMRQGRKERGLSVLPREAIFPDLPRRLTTREPKQVTSALEPDELLLPWEEERNQQRPLLRVLCAEQRIKEALQALENSELRQEPEYKLAWYEHQYEQEMATYVRVVGATSSTST